MFADNDNHHGTNCGVTSVILAPVIIMFGVTYLFTYLLNTYLLYCYSGEEALRVSINR